MTIIGEIVLHAMWGEGTIISLTDSVLLVRFCNEEKTFSYPTVFSKYLKFKDEKLQETILTLIQDEKNEALKKQEARKIVTSTTSSAVHQRIKKQPECLNIAFKCNFCDGGGKHNGIGFNGICSDFNIHYNIGIAHHSWCSSENSACYQYYCEQISRQELEEEMEYQEGVCYESVMLNRWRADAGFHLNGEKKNEPRRLKNIQINSLAVLTTRLPFTPESERFIFAVFLVDDGCPGGNRDAGFVTADSKFKMFLPLDKSKTLLYWNYYKNPKHPEKIAWGQGLYRYLPDEQAAAILRKFAELKQGTTEESLAREFLDYFCKTKKINLCDIPDTTGALC